MALPDLIYTLLTDPEITNLGTRVYPLVVPQDQLGKYIDAECAVTYQIIDNMPNEDKYASSKVDNIRVQLSCYGAKYSYAEAVLSSIRSRIDFNNHFTLADTIVQGIHLIDQRDMFDKSGELMGLSHDYIFRVQR